MKNIIKFAFLFCLIGSSYAQQRIPVYGDTTDLKKSTESGIVLLLEYGKGNHTGGGFFMRLDSTYSEGTYAFDCSNMPTYQWVRIGYPSSYFLASTIATATITTANVSTLNATRLGSSITSKDSTTSTILKSQNGKNWLIRVNNAGVLRADSTGLN